MKGMMLSSTMSITKSFSWLSPHPFLASFYPITLVHIVAKFHEQVLSGLSPIPRLLFSCKSTAVRLLFQSLHWDVPCQDLWCQSPWFLLSPQLTWSINQSGSPTCSTMSLQRHCSLSWFSFYLTDHFFLHFFACSSSPRPLFLSILNSLVILSSLKALNSN